MSVGIYDADLATYTLVCFNLEAMKLSAYYKQQREIVVLSPEFSPQKNTQFFFRKDYNDGKFPAGLMEPNVDYGGLAFTDNIYSPLPLEIERMRPDTSLYAKMEDKMRHDIFNALMKGEHCRLSLDGKTVWPEYKKQFLSLPTARNIFFHDYDLGAVEGSFEAVQDILKEATCDGRRDVKIGMKFPVQINNTEDLFKWTSLNPNSTFFFIAYNGVIDQDAFLRWTGETNPRAVYRLDYNCTADPSYTEEEFILEKIPQLYRQALISHSLGLPFLLRYDENFFSDKRWGRLLTLFSMFGNARSNRPKTTTVSYFSQSTLYDFAQWASRQPPMKSHNFRVSVKEMRKLFAFVKKKIPSLFEDFYLLTADQLIGG